MPAAQNSAGLRADYEALLAAQRKLRMELKAAKEEAEKKGNEVVVLQQKLKRVTQEGGPAPTLATHAAAPELGGGT